MTRYLNKLRKLWTRFSLASSETPVQHDWITITFNPQRARATSLGEVTHRGEKPSASLSPIGETATNWIPCSVTREKRYVRWLAKVGAASGLARFTIGARVSEPGMEVYAGEPLAPSDKTYYRARLGSRAHEGGCPCFAGVSGVCHIYRHFHVFLFSLLVSPKRARRKRVRVRRSRSIREPGRVSPVSFCTSINSSETYVKYLDNEREKELSLKSR